VQLATEDFRSIAQEGEHRDWTSIYRAFAARLLELAESNLGDRLGRHVDPQDVVQSAFRTFIRRAKDPGGFIGLAPGTDLWRLLLVITLNKIRKAGNYHRAAKRSISQTVRLADETVVDGRREELDMVILRMTLEEQLDKVEPAKRKMLVMYLSGMSVEEIAESINRAPRTVYRAVKSFEDMIEPMLHDADE
jgi:RNA polymerase sigma factor (sigma-70 family)